MRMIIGEGKILWSCLEKKKKTYDDYVPMNECGIVLFHSTHERVCAAQEITISMMKDIVDMYKLEI